MLDNLWAEGQKIAEHLTMPKAKHHHKMLFIPFVPRHKHLFIPHVEIAA
jgi:hypothetical protein